MSFTDYLDSISWVAGRYMKSDEKHCLRCGLTAEDPRLIYCPYCESTLHPGGVDQINDFTPFRNGMVDQVGFKAPLSSNQIQRLLKHCKSYPEYWGFPNLYTEGLLAIRKDVVRY